jgi:hypothetical protein
MVGGGWLNARMAGLGANANDRKRPVAEMMARWHCSLMLAQDDEEHPVPEALRPRFRELVSALVEGDFALSRHELASVPSIDADTAEFIAEQVAAYGDDLVPLSEAVWRRSIYRWMDGHWEFLIDLSTTREAVSDLALHANLFDDQDGRIEVWSVHVP